MLQVWVLEAKDLLQADIGGKADPFVQLQTRVQDLEKTVSPAHLLKLFSLQQMPECCKYSQSEQMPECCKCFTSSR